MKALAGAAFWLALVVIGVALFLSGNGAAEERASPTDPAASAMLRFFPSVAQPKTGQAFHLFVQADYGLTQDELVLEPVLTGSTTTQTTPSLWIVSVKNPTEVKPNAYLAVNIYSRNAREAKKLKDAIAQVNARLSALVQEIAEETDPGRKAALQAEQAEKTAFRTRLNAQLSALRVFVRSEGYSFSVAEDYGNPNFPHALSISPSVGGKAAGAALTIGGTGFPTTGANPVVKIGGRTATFVSRTATAITVTGPSFPTGGVKDVDVAFPDATAPRNTLLRSAYFVTE